MSYSHTLNKIIPCHIRLYRLFAMEVILATAFGRAIDIQRGESDDLTEIAYTISQSMGEGQLTSREMLYLIFSQFLFKFRQCSHSWYYYVICTSGNLPWAIPLSRLVFLYTSKGDLWKYMNKIALELVEARRSSTNQGRKVGNWCTLGRVLNNACMHDVY